MALKLEKIKEQKKNNSFTFMIKGADEAFANTIRRLIVEEVPTLAVEDIEIKDNNSALYDEMLALRLGLVPIKTDLSSYRLPENEDEVKERSARCTLQIKLKASKKGYVYAEEAESSDPKCTFVYPKMPVVKLLAKQKIDVNMTAVMGQGKVHTKWSPGWAFYKKEAKINMGKVENPELVAANSPDGVFSMKSGKLQLNQEKVPESSLIEYYADLDKGITYEYTDNIIFTVESWGQLSCKQILQKSSEILVEKAAEMESLL
ncbi:DNA-directed RNA polymerase subunit D [Candidatus Woesearchaeota archaeon CG10_big_fil_rev_8_21_14_0_10_45_16]|nr:MAG: DNA-directed RNA polymerase subunit D [Candidatus Woesearchaeota archaeon CG10_big_fil_rev_8_21_14_0_10_45_16]